MPPRGINAATLARMRANNVSLSPDTCTIEDIGLVNDTTGKKRGWTQVATGVKCYFDTAASNKVQGSQSKHAKSGEILVYFNITAPITETCRIIHNSQYYELWDIEDDHTDGIYKKAKVRRVTP